MRSAFLILVAIVLTVACSQVDKAQLARFPDVSFAGFIDVPLETIVQGHVLVGLSAVTTYDGSSYYYAISDDPSEPAIFKLELSLDSENKTVPTDVTFLQRIQIADQNGIPIEPGMADIEGLQRSKSGTFWISSKGIRPRAQPFIGEFDADGRLLRTLKLPESYLISPNQGVRNSGGFEALALSPDETLFYAATEQALLQDGMDTGPNQRSMSRLLVFSVDDGELLHEFVYPVDAVQAVVSTTGSNSLVEIVAHRFLSLERSSSVDNAEPATSKDVRLYLVERANATDIKGLKSLHGESFNLLEKTLLINFDEFLSAGLLSRIGSFEGMAIWRPQADDKIILLLVEDTDGGRSTQIVSLLIDKELLL